MNQKFSGSVLVTVPNRADARDIVQETAVTLWTQFDKYDEARPFVNWAVGYARIQVRRFLRERARQAVLSERAAEFVLAVQDEQAPQRELYDAALRLCLERLPAASRKILASYYFEERTVEVIAGRFERSNEAIYETLQRLRAALLECVTTRLSHA